MSVLGNSQSSLPLQTVYNGENAVIISETQMDTISLKLLRFNVLISKYDAIGIELEKSRKENEKLMVSVDFLAKDNSSLKLMVTNLKEQSEIKDKKFGAELTLWKAKAKERFKYLLYGTGIGGVIMAILIKFI